MAQLPSENQAKCTCDNEEKTETKDSEPPPCEKRKNYSYEQTGSHKSCYKYIRSRHIQNNLLILIRSSCHHFLLFSVFQVFFLPIPFLMQMRAVGKRCGTGL